MLDRLVRWVSRERPGEATDAQATAEPFALPEDASTLVRRRRAARRVKAGVAVVVAVAAGAFLSCQRMVGNVEPDAAPPPPTGTDQPPPPTPREDPTPPTVTEPTDAGPTPDATPSEQAPAAADANDVPPDQADAPQDALVPVTPARRRRSLDVREHRRGMPVRDNLLE